MGCEKCVGGYLGRIGLYELLIITPQVQQQILTNQPIVSKNMVTLRQVGNKLVRQGITTLAELNRVLGNN